MDGEHKVVVAEPPQSIRQLQESPNHLREEVGKTVGGVGVGRCLDLTRAAL